MNGQRQSFLILDANVLIDIITCDPTLLTLISEFVGPIRLATTILDEVKTLNQEVCRELSIQLVEPTLEQVMVAADMPKPLSFQDWICLLMAQENNWICVSNDKPLRKQCELKNVSVMWELEMLCLLVEAGGLTAAQCKTIILDIQKSNRYITNDIVKSAFQRLKIQHSFD